MPYSKAYWGSVLIGVGIFAILTVDYINIETIVAKATASKADYIKTRAQDDDYYCKLITDYLKKFNKASRGEIDKLLMEKLSSALDNEQKKKKIANLLTKLRRSGKIQNDGSKKAPKWILAE